MDIHVPAREELLKGCQEYEMREQRDAMYKVATFLLDHFWGNYAEMTNGLGVLLLTWNNAFYRYGPFSFDSLESCISIHFSLINTFRNRDITSLIDNDEQAIKKLFTYFLDALQIVEDKSGRGTPVGVAKALHLLGPKFFPIWDVKISKRYGCNYGSDPADKYFMFCKKIKDEADIISMYEDLPKKPLVKILDEYNYSKYTKMWIK
jgi:hypothetical protein